MHPRKSPSEKYNELKTTLNTSLAGLISDAEKAKYRELIVTLNKRITDQASDSTYKRVNRELVFYNTVIHITIIKEKMVDIIGNLPADQKKQLHEKIAIEEKKQLKTLTKPKHRNQHYYRERQTKIEGVLARLSLILQELKPVVVTVVLNEQLNDFKEKQEPISILNNKVDELAGETRVFTKTEKPECLNDVKEIQEPISIINNIVDELPSETRVLTKTEKPGCFAGFMMCLFPCTRKEKEEERKPLMEDVSTNSYGSAQL